MAVRNSFIALGVTYFISAWFAPRLIARYSTSAIRSRACDSACRPGGADRHVPSLGNAEYRAGPGHRAGGQALIVNSFYRIGMRDIQPDDAGAAGAILSTLQQAALGLGNHFGAILLHGLQNHHELYPGGQRLPDGGNGHDGGAGAGHAAYASSSVFTGRQGLSGDKIKLPEFA